MPRMPRPKPPARSKAAYEAVRRIVKHHLGSGPVKVSPQEGGLSNLVFFVAHGSEEYVVRLNLNRAKLNPFLKEQWATTCAGKVGVPVPEILEVGNDPFPFMVLRKTPGQTADHNPERLRILYDLGRYAARINGIVTHGFGATFDWSHNQLSQNEGWHEFLHTEIRLDHRLRVLRRLRMVSDKQAETIRDVLESACRKGRRPALNHGDLRPKNVLVDDKNRITAILDWENCTSSLSPEWELAIALHDLSIDEKHEFLGGYGIGTKTLAAIAPAIKALNLIHYVPSLERFAKEKKTEQIAQYRLRLGGALDLYSL